MKAKIIFCCWLVCLAFGLNVFAQEKAAQEIEKLLQTAYQKGEYSGALVVAKGDRIIYRGAVGLANREWNIPNKPETKFRINSITKQFTTMLLMQLVEAGKVDLDAKIGVYIKDFPKTFGEKITVRNLLLSSSGLPDFDVPEFYATENENLTKFDFLTKTFLKGDVTFEPGSKFNYNNADFLLAGAIIEQVAGKSFAEVLDEKILQPLKMKNTGLIKSGEVYQNLANGYLYEDGKFYKEPFYSIENYGSAGALYSTLDDMLLWDRALIENKLLSKEKTAEMFTAAPSLGFVALGSWVYNLKVNDETTYKLIERQGGIGGFSSLNIISTDENISVIFLGNIGTDTLFRTYAKQGLSFEVLKVLAEN